MPEDKRGVDLISDVLPFGRLWYGGSEAVSHAVAYAQTLARELGPSATILVNLSGRGDKDVHTMEKYVAHR